MFAGGPDHPPLNVIVVTHRSLVFHCRHSSFNPSEAPPWDSRPVSGVGGVHYHLLHRPRSVPTALGPAPLATVILRDPHSKVSAKGPEFLVALNAIRPIHSYHLVFTPYSPFLTVTRLRSFLHMKVKSSQLPPHKQSLFSRVQCVQ